MKPGVASLAITMTCVVFVTGVFAQTPTPPPAQSAPIRITGATLHTISGGTIENGEMVFADGRIVGIGPAGAALPPADTVVDLGGLDVYPGLIAANTTIGIVEIEAVRATVDVGEPGPINPNVRAERAVNPESENIPVARANGVLAVLTVPQGGDEGLIVGQSAVIALDGWTWEDMTIRAPVGMHVVWPRMTIPADLPEQRREELEQDRDDKLELLRESFEAARAYRLARDNGEDQPVDVRWEAMLPVLDGTVPVFAHVDRLVGIRHALALADEFGFRLVLVGAGDAWRIASTLAEKNVPVIVSSVHRLPLRRWEGYSQPAENAVRLAAAGVLFAIASDGSTFSAPLERNLPYQAAAAVAHGLPVDEALKAITLNPARILGVDDRIGSLDVGRDATFIVTDGNPLEITTRVLRTWVRGRPIDLTSRQNRLYDKYRERLEQLGVPGVEDLR